MDVLTTLVFDRPLFSPDVITLFENWDTGKLTFLDISQEFFLEISGVFVLTGVTTT